MNKEINLKEIFLIIRKRLWIIAVMVILAAFSGYMYTTIFKAQSLYYSSTRLVIRADNNNMMSTLMVMIKDSALLEQVSQSLQNTRSPGTLSSEITATNVDNSQVISISVIDRDPRLAAQIANTTATVFKSQASKILNFNGISTLSEAKPDSIPINPTSNNKIIYSAIIGLVIGLGLVFFIHSLDDSVQTEKELEKLLEVPVLGSIAKMKKRNMLARRNSSKISKETEDHADLLKMGVKKRRIAVRDNEIKSNIDLALKSSSNS
ncbi:MAG: YveK family protein [Tuberibacillus sp.]